MFTVYMMLFEDGNDVRGLRDDERTRIAPLVQRLAFGIAAHREGDGHERKHPHQP